ncbi:MAG: YihY family inner membrane protein [Pseudomonadota bacterium]
MTPITRLWHGWRLLKAVVREYRDSGCKDSAASLTYTTLFAVVPMMTVAFALLKLAPQLHGIGDRIEGLIFENFVPATGEQVKTYLAVFAEQAASLTGVGVLFLLVTSVMMLVTVERAFNRVWRVHRPRRLLSSLLVYWALLTLGPLLLGTGLAVSTWLATTQTFSDTVGRIGLWSELLSVLPFLLGAVFFSLVYIAVPNCHVPAREGVIGGVVASALMEAARHTFTFFVGGFSSYQLVYGAFAAVPLFLLWLYISWAITLFGLVLVYVLVNRDDEEIRPATAFPALLKVLALFQARQREGLAVQDYEARLEARRAGIDNWHEYRERFLARRILDRDERGGLLLVRDLHALRLADLARVLNWDSALRRNGSTEPDEFAAAMAERLRAAVAAFDAGLDEPVASVLERAFPPAKGGSVP